MCRTLVRMLLPVLFSSMALAQGDGPQFEAVSIKRNTSGSRSASVGTRPDLSFDMTNVAPPIPLGTRRSSALQTGSSTSAMTSRRKQVANRVTTTCA